MGIYQSLYIGPVFYVTTSKDKVDTTRSYTLCTSIECPFYDNTRNPPEGIRWAQCPRDAKFCPSCGAATKVEKVVTGQKEVDQVSYGDLEEALRLAGFTEDTLHICSEFSDDEDGAMLFILNKGVEDGNNGNIGFLNGDRGFPNLALLSSCDTKRFMDTFAAENSGYRNVLINLYGKDNVNVDWATLNYWS